MLCNKAATNAPLRSATARSPRSRCTSWNTEIGLSGATTGASRAAPPGAMQGIPTTSRSTCSWDLTVRCGLLALCRHTICSPVAEAGGRSHAAAQPCEHVTLTERRHDPGDGTKQAHGASSCSRRRSALSALVIHPSAGDNLAASELIHCQATTVRLYQHEQQSRSSSTKLVEVMEVSFTRACSRTGRA